MKINMLIAEKDKCILNSITSVVRKQGNTDLFTCFSGFSKIINNIKKNNIDMAFIDTDLLRSHVRLCIRMLVKKFKGLKIVLISNTIDYLGLAFDIMAAGYILKPVHEIEVVNCLKRMENWSSKLRFNGIVVHLKGKVTFVNLNDILYIEAYNRKCIIHTVKDQYAIYKSIKSMLTNLPVDTFIQSHRAFIINISKIKDIEQFNKTSYNVNFSKDKVALLSRRYLKEFKSKCNFLDSRIS